MREKKIGSHRSFIIEAEDLVVVMGDLEGHADLLRDSGFEQHKETGEWLGRGKHLYSLDPDVFFRLFSARDAGHPDLVAQATDGKDFYQIDALPVVSQGDDGENRIEELQEEAASGRGFLITGHVHRLSGICRWCSAKLRLKGQLEQRLAALRGGSQSDSSPGNLS